MDSTIFIARLLGMFTVILGLAILLNRRGLVAAMDDLVRSRPALLIVEMIGLAVGLAIVIVHNEWQGGVLAVVVTLLAWFILLRAVVLLLLPQEIIERIFQKIGWDRRSSLYAAITLLIGLYLTIAGFSG